MFVHTFRSLHARFDATGFGAVLSPRKPRHPLLRIAFGLLGLALLAVLLVVGVFVGAAMLVAGLIGRLLLSRGAKPSTDARVVDAEYRVVRKPALPLSR
jgi:hypothetical protein